MREKVTALLLLLVVGFYSATIGWRGVELVRDGRPSAVGLGLAVIAVPLVLLVALVPLLRLGRDGARMVRQANSDEPPGAQDEGWRAELVLAERCRVAGDRTGEQRHYRAAIRAWRATRG